MNLHLLMLRRMLMEGEGAGEGGTPPSGEGTTPPASFCSPEKLLPTLPAWMSRQDRQVNPESALQRDS